MKAKKSANAQGVNGVLLDCGGALPQVGGSVGHKSKGCPQSARKIIYKKLTKLMYVSIFLFLFLCKKDVCIFKCSGTFLCCILGRPNSFGGGGEGGSGIKLCKSVLCQSKEELGVLLSIGGNLLRSHPLKDWP